MHLLAAGADMLIAAWPIPTLVSVAAVVEETHLRTRGCPRHSIRRGQCREIRRIPTLGGPMMLAEAVAAMWQLPSPSCKCFVI